MLGPLQLVSSPPTSGRDVVREQLVASEGLKQEGNVMGCIHWRGGPRASSPAPGIDERLALTRTKARGSPGL